MLITPQSGLYVLGATRLTLDEFSPIDVTMSMTCDGEEVSTGTGAACLGDPLNALAWLASAALEYGEPLRAGQVVLSGALGPVHPVPAGAVVRAEISHLGSVTATFSVGEHLMQQDQGRRDRLGQHRHRPDDQDHAHLPRRWRWPRWSASIPTPMGSREPDVSAFPTTAEGVDGLIAMDGFDDIEIVFDATSAGAHRANAASACAIRQAPRRPDPRGDRAVRRTARQPRRPTLDAENLNMVTCGGQATIPIVYAVSRVTTVPYAEIVASVASKSAGPGTRANIDEFTETTALAIEEVGGAWKGKAIIILNPAEPPLIMRDTVFCLIDDPSGALQPKIRESVEEMVASVAEYVPGYRLKQEVQFTPVDSSDPVHTLLGKGVGEVKVSHKVSVFLEVEGAAHYLPAYAGNLDIMTSAALRVGEQVAAQPEGCLT
ncbi:MAG: acetaldehyde dehydrogenase (acetylating) [Nocardioides sp.]